MELEPMFLMDKFDPRHGDDHPRTRKEKGAIVDIEELDKLDPTIGDARGVQMLMEIAEINTQELIDAGIDAELARKIGLKVSDQLRKTYGGEKIYVTKGVIIDITRKHWQIYDEFTGRNHLMLAKKYNLNTRQIEKIIARCRKEWDRKHQIPLFANEG